tara:strand:+ start:261 stop:446 length:186 start_codon:yes stop_codon:yes gene_type:complete
MFLVFLDPARLIAGEYADEDQVLKQIREEYFNAAVYARSLSTVSLYLRIFPEKTNKLFIPE